MKRPLEVGTVLRLSASLPRAAKGGYTFHVRVVYVGRYSFRGLVLASNNLLSVGQEFEYSLFYWRNGTLVEDPIYKEKEPLSIEDCM